MTRKLFLGLFVAVAMMSVGCSKGDDTQYSQEQLQGTWTYVNVIFPDGELGSEKASSIIEKQAFQCARNTSFTFGKYKGRNTFQGEVYYGVLDNNNFSCLNERLPDSYLEVRGDTLRIINPQNNTEYIDIFKIISLKDDELRLIFTNKYKQKMLAELENSNMNFNKSDDFIKWALDNTIILKKVN